MKKNYTKLLVIALAVVTLFSAVTIGTLAYLMKKTNSITNTFTMGDITLTLTEDGATGNAKTWNVIPGETVTKKATVGVTTKSDDAWVFIKVDTENLENVTADADQYGAAWSMNEEWTALIGEGVDAGVFYKKFTKGDSEQTLDVLKDNQLTISNKGIDNADGKSVTMTFTAYAIQASNLPYGEVTEDAAQALVAWDQVKNLGSST